MSVHLHDERSAAQLHIEVSHPAKGKFTMAAFSIDSKKLIKAALEQMSPGMEHVCILPAVTFVKLTRIINLVQSETTVTAAGGDECPPGSLDLDKNAVPQD